MYASKTRDKALITKVKKKEITNWDTYQFNPEEDLSEGYLKEKNEKIDG